MSLRRCCDSERLPPYLRPLPWRPAPWTFSATSCRRSTPCRHRPRPSRALGSATHSDVSSRFRGLGSVTVLALRVQTEFLPGTPAKRRSKVRDTNAGSPRGSGAGRHPASSDASQQQRAAAGREPTADAPPPEAGGAREEGEAGRGHGGRSDGVSPALALRPFIKREGRPICRPKLDEARGVDLPGKLPYQQRSKRLLVAQPGSARACTSRVLQCGFISVRFGSRTWHRRGQK